MFRQQVTVQFDQWKFGPCNNGWYKIGSEFCSQVRYNCLGRMWLLGIIYFRVESRVWHWKLCEGVRRNSCISLQFSWGLVDWFLAQVCSMCAINMLVDSKIFFLTCLEISCGQVVRWLALMAQHHAEMVGVKWWRGRSKGGWLLSWWTLKWLGWYEEWLVWELVSG